ncbi:MAG: MarP family serine protease [Microthrixaceae bacterium]
MNGLDLVIVIGALAAVIGGWSLGFIRRIGGWLGVACGLAVALMTLPTLVESLGMSNDRYIFILGGSYLILMATAGQGLGEAIGSRVRSTVDTSGGRYADSFGGSALGLVGVVVVVWLLFPVMAGAQGWPAKVARSSNLARSISQALPDPPPQITTLERQLAGGGFPRLFDRIRPAPDLEPPPQVELPDELYSEAVDSIVRVEAPACNKIQSGSGFYVAPNMVMTNAHVVAGSTDTVVQDVNGDELPATVIHFDPNVDLAVLVVNSDRPPLPVADPTEGNQGLVMGFPGGGPFDPSPFQVAQRVRATGYDIYDSQRVERDLLILSSDLQPGDSGSAVLRSDGAVVGVAVAIAPDRPSVAYALDATEIRNIMRATDPSTADTGPCR